MWLDAPSWAQLRDVNHSAVAFLQAAEKTLRTRLEPIHPAYALTQQERRGLLACADALMALSQATEQAPVPTKLQTAFHTQTLTGAEYEKASPVHQILFGHARAVGIPHSVLQGQLKIASSFSELITAYQQQAQRRGLYATGLKQDEPLYGGPQLQVPLGLAELKVTTYHHILNKHAKLGLLLAAGPESPSVAPARLDFQHSQPSTPHL